MTIEEMKMEDRVRHAVDALIRSLELGFDVSKNMTEFQYILYEVRKNRPDYYDTLSYVN